MDDYYLTFIVTSNLYDEWRYATYDEGVRLRQMQKQARNRLLASAALLQGGLRWITKRNLGWRRRYCWRGRQWNRAVVAWTATSRQNSRALAN